MRGGFSAQLPGDTDTSRRGTSRGKGLAFDLSRSKVTCHHFPPVTGPEADSGDVRHHQQPSPTDGAAHHLHGAACPGEPQGRAGCGLPQDRSRRCAGGGSGEVSLGQVRGGPLGAGKGGELGAGHGPGFGAGGRSGEAHWGRVLCRPAHPVAGWRWGPVQCPRAPASCQGPGTGGALACVPHRGADLSSPLPGPPQVCSMVPTQQQ